MWAFAFIALVLGLLVALASIQGGARLIVAVGVWRQPSAGGGPAVGPR